MELDMGKRRSLMLALFVLVIMATGLLGAAFGLLTPVARWFHDQATATVPFDNPEYMYSRALQYDEDGNTTYAMAAARRAVVIRPEYAEPRRFIAAKDLKNHDFADAAAQCRGLLSSNPNDSSALLGLAAADNGLGNPKQAEALYRKVMENTVNTENVRNAAQHSLDSLDHNPGGSSAPSLTPPAP